MNFILRNATSSDFEAIAKISINAYQEYSTQLSCENWQKMESTLANVNLTANKGDFIVAEEDTELVGAIVYYACGVSNSQFFDSQWASLRLLAVPPNHRSRGIGKKLIEEGILRAKKDCAKGIGLYTSEIMTTAQKIYSNLGFRRARELPSMLGLRYWLYLLLLQEE